MKRKGMSELALSSLTEQIMNIFFDAWILMLALGGLSHHLKLNINFSYVVCILIIIISVCLIPQNILLTKIIKEQYENGKS